MLNMVFQVKKFVVYKTSFINEIVWGNGREDGMWMRLQRQSEQKKVYIP